MIIHRHLYLGLPLLVGDPSSSREGWGGKRGDQVKRFSITVGNNKGIIISSSSRARSANLRTSEIDHPKLWIPREDGEMEFRQESSNVVALHSSTNRIISSSSSSAFVSASQSPFISPQLEIGVQKQRLTATKSRAKEKRPERRRANPHHLPSSSGWHASSDVYLGFHGSKPSLLRFTKWVRAELEIHGISCFSADRARCKNARSRDIAERAMKDAAFGVIILTDKSFANSPSLEELGFFLSRKNFVPVFFDLRAGDCFARDVVERRGDIWERNGGELWALYGGDEREWRSAVEGLSKFEGIKIETREENWRSSVVQLVVLLAARLGRRSATERINRWRKMVEKEELPFPRKENFAGRKKELSEMEHILFGDIQGEYSEERPRHRRGKKKESKLSGKGIVCVSGKSGIGKTELLLEYAYRFSQRYKTVFWVSGETRYLRQSYLNLRSFLEVDTSVELGRSERVRPRCFEEQEEEAVAKVKRELSRDIPYLVIIDNLESEEDWFDKKSVINLLPQFGGETHIIISTRLLEVMNLEPIKLSHLSAAEAMSLMKGTSLEENLGFSEVAALQIIEEKLERLPLGLSIVGSILSEIPISPSKLLDTINRKLENNCRRHERGNPFMKQLLDLCISIFHHAGGSLAVKMLQASCWFAPGPVPTSLLAMAGKKNSTERRVFRPRRKRKSESQATSILLRFGIARACLKPNCVCFHDCVKLHAIHQYGDAAAVATIQAIALRASVSNSPEQIWAASFLLFSYNADPAVVKLNPTDLLLFVKRAALPLSVHSFFAFSRCIASLDLLRHCAVVLDAAADALISGGDDWGGGTVCCGRISRWGEQKVMRLWRELGLLRAGVMETRAKLMMRGGMYDEADELVRKAIFIRTSISGECHQETIAARETLAKLTRLISAHQLSSRMKTSPSPDP